MRGHRKVFLATMAILALLALALGADLDGDDAAQWIAVIMSAACAGNAAEHVAGRPR